MGSKIYISQAVQNISKFVPGTIILGIHIFMTDHANKAWGLNSVGFMNRQQLRLVVCCTECQAPSLPYQQQYIKIGALDGSRVASASQKLYSGLGGDIILWTHPEYWKYFVRQYALFLFLKGLMYVHVNMVILIIR